MDSIACAKRKIRRIIAGSKVPEDPQHAENTLEWVLKLEPSADPSLQIAALAHDIDRAIDEQKVQRADFSNYDDFKAAHARNGANLLRTILNECDVEKTIAAEACRLVALHETGGDPASDLLKDADSISYFEVNMPRYYQREGWDETMRRCMWGYRRLSVRMQGVVENITYQDEALTRLLNESIRKAGSGLINHSP